MCAQVPFRRPKHPLKQLFSDLSAFVRRPDARDSGKCYDLRCFLCFSGSPGTSGRTPENMSFSACFCLFPARAPGTIISRGKSVISWTISSCFQLVSARGCFGEKSHILIALLSAYFVCFLHALLVFMQSFHRDAGIYLFHRGFRDGF